MLTTDKAIRHHGTLDPAQLVHLYDISRAQPPPSRWEQKAANPMLLAFDAITEAGWEALDAVTCIDLDGLSLKITDDGPMEGPRRLKRDIGRKRDTKEALRKTEGEEQDGIEKHGVWLEPLQILAQQELYDRGYDVPWRCECGETDDVAHRVWGKCEKVRKFQLK